MRSSPHGWGQNPNSHKPWNNIDRVLRRVVADMVTDCWLFTGALSGGGYGYISIDGRHVRAHRYVYEQLVGEIPEGLQLDHLCEVKCCVNPEHLEPVTLRENSLRYHDRRRAEK